MANVTATDLNWVTATITTLPEVQVVNQQAIQELLSAVLHMHLTIPIEKITLDAAAFPATYTCKLRDGRQWVGTIQERAPDPLMTISLVTPWRFSEISIHRSVWQACVTLLTSHKVTDIKLVPR